MPEFTMTKHAVQRALEMALDPDEIREAFEKPRNVHRSDTQGLVYLTRGRVVLAVGESNAIVTIMWARVSDYRSDMEHGGYDTRDGSKASKTRAAVRARRRDR